MGKDPEEEYIVAKNADEALQKAREKYGRNVEIYQDSDVLDTWFSRSVFKCNPESLLIFIIDDRTADMHICS